jgi:hypothetical protein
MREQRSGGRHETKWNSASTLERQDTGVSPLARYGAQDKIMDADPAMPTKLWAPGRGKAAGTKRTIPYNPRR